MPGWLRPIAQANPVTVVVNATRGLVSGAPDTATVVAALARMAGLVVIFAPIALVSYRRRA